MAYLTISQLQADKPALLEFVRAAGQGILTQLQGSPASAAAAGPAAGGTPAAAATAGPGPDPSPAQAVVQQQQPPAATQLTESMGMGHMDLEGTASFNLDVLLGGTGHETPNPAAALGPAL